MAEKDIISKETIRRLAVDLATHLLERDTPDALVLAILCDFGDHDPQAVVNHIYIRLQTLLGNNPKRFREYVEMVHILSGNRDLEKQIQEADKMLTQIDVERLPAYRQVMEKGLRQGIEKGMERGMEKGLKRGIEQGRGEGEAVFLMRLLRHKFGPLSPALEQRIRNAEPEALATWGERVLSAQTLDEVFSCF
uniref:DUF4351 domain-containing protein n=1 Tax=Candidatus Kentrum sp. LFY TaxID=2126342 RepID=A0A450W9J6_9GAMM|nr:MAG: protein of unknown function (DUF4351) [Candidatus Kentron sp. LFY]